MSKRGPMPECSKFLIAFISANYTSINLKHNTISLWYNTHRQALCTDCVTIGLRNHPNVTFKCYKSYKLTFYNAT